MDPVTGLLASQAIQGVTGLLRNAVSPEPATPEEEEKKFDDSLAALLRVDGQNRVNEEELFAGILQERITALKGDEAGESYKEALNRFRAEMKRADGYIPVEDAANKAMAEMVESGVLSQEEGSKIKAEAFSAAQLDSNKSALYDGRGGPGDETIAVSSLESALLSARAILEKFDSGEETPLETIDKSSDVATEAEKITPKGNEIDGANGFVWKPESDHGKTLVVLMPERLAHKVDQVLLKDEDGNKVEDGRSTGYANGGREHWRFSTAGKNYPDNIVVEVRLSDGSVREYKIPDPSQRYD